MINEVIRQSKPRAPLARTVAILSSLVILGVLVSPLRAGAGENRDQRLGGERHALPGESDIVRMDRFVLFNEKLKGAVCDDKAAAKAPTLAALASADEHGAGAELSLVLPKSVAESELISFLLGDSVAGIYSDFVRSQVTEALGSRGLAKPLAARALTPEQFVEAQAVIQGVKHNVSLEVCQALVQVSRLKELLNAHPSRFLEAVAGPAAPRAAGFVADVLDSDGRFARVGARGPGSSKSARDARYLIPGWIEAFEIERVAVRGPGGETLRTYNRLFNPLTNNTQGIELTSREGVPLGVLSISHDPLPQGWAALSEPADETQTRARQIETYRARVESEAVRFLEKHGEKRDQVRNLQEFYKDLLKAYQLFPNEKQFDTYAHADSRHALKPGEVSKKILGPAFLEALRQARVNGSYVHVALFAPDPKLHAIYREYHARLEGLARR